MMNIERIKWMYNNFGMGMAIWSAVIDLMALLIYIGYTLTLPFLFFLIICRGRRQDKKTDE